VGIQTKLVMCGCGVLSTVQKEKGERRKDQRRRRGGGGGCWYLWCQGHQYLREPCTWGLCVVSSLASSHRLLSAPLAKVKGTVRPIKKPTKVSSWRHGGWGVSIAPQADFFWLFRLRPPDFCAAGRFFLALSPKAPLLLPRRDDFF
jgi:hypothetical protein